MPPAIPYSPRHTIGRVRDLRLRERGIFNESGRRAFPDDVPGKWDHIHAHAEARVVALTLLAEQELPLFPEPVPLSASLPHETIAASPGAVLSGHGGGADSLTTAGR